ncbi:MAG: hypothetical protein IIB00_08865 [candidate division Zixibacteria bacterium]|nr:hypothetical protein [candidate division Zixibacteria bacterium]
MGFAIYIRKVVTWRFWSLVFVSVSFSITQLGCATITFRNIRPIKEHRPVIIFDRYLLDLEGSAIEGDSTIGFYCDVDFVEKVRSETDFDSIPIFIIDSLCFSGECLNSSFCHTLINDRDLNNYIFENRGLPFRRMLKRSNEDLNWDNKYVWPTGYHLVDTQKVLVPLSCKDKNMTVKLFTRLLDRVSGQLIAEEVRTVEFDIWNRTYLVPD